MVELTNPEQSIKESFDQTYTPYFNQTRGNISRRGFGSDIYAPQVENQAFAPIMAQKATGQSNALTDLFFKQENLKLNQEGMKINRQNSNFATDEGRRGGKVICTELHRQGKLKEKYMRADLVYLAEYVTPEIHQQYKAWAIPLVLKMRLNRLLSAVIFPIAFLWNMYMYRIVNKEKLGILGTLGYWIHLQGIKYGRYYALKQQKVTVQ